MDILVNLLDVVFRRIQPEYLCNSGEKAISENSEKLFIKQDSQVSSKHISLDVFLNASDSCFHRLSREERIGMYNIMRQLVETEGKGRIEGGSIYNLLLCAVEKFLRFSGDTVYCRSQYTLDWQECYLNLGQDIFTTISYANNDLCQGIWRDNFLWPTVIRTDDDAIYQMLKKGLAENHSHLGGTSQPFAVMWSYLMNHPRKMRESDFFLQRNMQATERRSWKEEIWSWEKRLLLAAWIRANLFCQYKNVELKNSPGSMLGFFDQIEPCTKLSNDIDMVCQLYGLKLEMPNGRHAVLDYALENTMVHAREHVDRLLAGERSFMYQCFRRILSGNWSKHQSDAFYLYLLLKLNFRAEIVQVNREYGFTNFKEYQDRKGWFYENDLDYDAEMTRIAINSNMLDYYIKLFETRIAPAKSRVALEQKIRRIDEAVKLFGVPENPYFFVVHFIKTPDKGNDVDHNGLLLPRNAYSRELALKGAKALKEAMTREKVLRYRILGIDAASTEIGCHPEVFARVFRGLKTYMVNDQSLLGSFDDNRMFSSWFAADIHSGKCGMSNTGKPVVRTLGVTYHAGEDFYDMADGLRSIDEAIRFLRMERGARIGHALALGVEPKTHYETKNMISVLPKHEYLDNLIWLIFKSEELQVSIDPLLQREFESIAGRLMDELYGKEIKNRGWHPIGFRKYYCSWCLRGDPPEWYENYEFSPKRYVEDFGDEEIDKSLDVYRNDAEIAFLYGCYHYSKEVRRQGEKVEEQKISSSYMALIRTIQERMIQQLGIQGISIECNPTSNYLIGTFRDYGKHPLLRFYPIQESTTEHRWIKASINTDDLGVFDTSIENEYIIMAAALREKTNERGERLYSDDEIERYLDRVRENGMQQSFWNKIR